MMAIPSGLPNGRRVTKSRIHLRNRRPGFRSAKPEKTPSTKLQHPEKLQTPSTKQFTSGIWRLVFGYSLELGCWILELFSACLDAIKPRAVRRAVAERQNAARPRYHRADIRPGRTAVQRVAALELISPVRRGIEIELETVAGHRRTADVERRQHGK